MQRRFHRSLNQSRNHGHFNSYSFTTVVRFLMRLYCAKTKPFNVHERLDEAIRELNCAESRKSSKAKRHFTEADLDGVLVAETSAVLTCPTGISVYRHLVFPLKDVNPGTFYPEEMNGIMPGHQQLIHRN